MEEVRPDLAPIIVVENSVGESTIDGESTDTDCTVYTVEYRGQPVFHVAHWRFKDGEDCVEMERVGHGEIEQIEEAK